MRRLFVCLLSLVALTSTGCGDIAYQTRHLPRASQLSYDAEYKELPWQEPSLGDKHHERNGRPAIPKEAHMINYNVDWDVYGFHYDGDGDAADSGKLEPLELD